MTSTQIDTLPALRTPLESLIPPAQRLALGGGECYVFECPILVHRKR